MNTIKSSQSAIVHFLRLHAVSLTTNSKQQKQHTTERNELIRSTTMKQFLYAMFVMTFVSMAAANKYIGSWKVTDFIQDERPMALPKDSDILLTLKSDDEVTYHITMKIGNRFMGSLMVTGKTSDDTEAIEMGHLAGTRMMAPPELQPLEAFVTNQMPQMKEMFVVSDMLVIQGPTAQVICERNDDLLGSS
jgi:META domain